MSFGSVAHAASTSVNVWWPAANAQVTGVQPFKAMVNGLSTSDYQMYWQVDGGQWNSTADNATDYPHKEASVDVSNWHWNSSGVYTITFIAVDKNGAVLAKQSVPVVVSASSVTTSVQKAVVQSAPVASAPAPAPKVATVVSASKLYVNPSSSAAAQANAWRQTRPADAALMDVLAKQPTATWLGGWNSNVQSDVDAIETKAAQTSSVPVFVAYNIPGRDCGGYSAGGAAPDQYLNWIRSVAAGIGSRGAYVVLEPDALANISCLSSSAASERITLINKAIATLKAGAHTKVYVDAGHAGWTDASVMAGLLRQVNVSQADGFALNVSNFGRSADQVAYGTQVSNALGGGKHFIIDTARNGNGPDANNTWCNPSGRAVGAAPTLSTGTPLLDGYLWLKTPGESDGNCNGGPNAGVWWPDYALGLISNSSLR